MLGELLRWEYFHTRQAELTCKYTLKRQHLLSAIIAVATLEFHVLFGHTCLHPADLNWKARQGVYFSLAHYPYIAQTSSMTYMLHCA